MLGPLCYPLLPLMLDKSLAAAGAGIAVDVSPDMFDRMRVCDVFHSDHVEILAKADQAASTRLHILLIADDQILPASHSQSSQASVNLASEWATMTGQHYHVDKPDKTAVLLLGKAAQSDAYNSAPIVLSDRVVPSTVGVASCGTHGYRLYRSWTHVLQQPVLVSSPCVHWPRAGGPH